MISAVDIIQYSSDVKRVGQGQDKMVEGSPSEQVPAGLRPEGQEEASHVKTEGGMLQLEKVHRLGIESCEKHKEGWVACWLGVNQEGPGSRCSQRWCRRETMFLGPRKEC